MGPAVSWGVNHPLYVRAQIHHGLEEAGYGYWGFSPSNNPDGGYREYGVDAIGMDADGYTSDQERTLVDRGFEGCREPARRAPTALRPRRRHAARVVPRARLRDARRRSRTSRSCAATSTSTAPGGFYDAVDVGTGKVSRYYLALDQGMVMAAIANELGHDRLQRYLAPRARAARSSRCSRMERVHGGGGGR